MEDSPAPNNHANANTSRDMKEIITLLKRSTLPDNTLWDLGDIGTYMNLSKSSIQRRIVNKSGFPRAIRLPTESGQGGRRWKPQEVKDWTMRHREPVSRA